MDFNLLLEESVKIHGHLCAGQVLGVRMTMLGLKSIGISDPRGADRKKLIVFVEMDRCATDAVQSVAAVSLGKRSMKFMDFGKMAASFLNLETNKAVRVLALEESRDKAKQYFPDMENKYEAQLEAYKVMPDEDLFTVTEVNITLPACDMPGRPLSRVQCDSCGEHVQDNREVITHGKTLCKACSGDAYYSVVDQSKADGFFMPGDMQEPHNGEKQERFGIRSKLWIEVDGEPVFGRGRMMLLRAIGTHGSISQAAKEISVSYRKAWGYIKAMETRLNVPLVSTHKGGKNGGGAELTAEAKIFIEKYAELEQGVREVVDTQFEKVF
jgi:formylmethanofuran dehydrogenase subunit E